MRRSAARVAVVATLVAMAMPLAPASAVADTTTEAAASGAYFWKQKLPSTLQGQPNPINGQDTDADGVARDDLAVALTTRGENASDKETFLAWDLLELDPEATISKFVVTVLLSEKGPSPEPPQNTVQTNEKTALLRACGPKGGFGPTDAGAYEVKPEIDYATCVPGTFDPAKNGYVFDVTTLTTTWLTTANNGIAIVPDKPTEQAPFQAVFQPTAAHIAEIEFTPGAGAGLEDITDDAFSAGGDVATDTGTTDFSGSTGSTDSFLSSAPASAFSGGSGTAFSPSIDTALPETAPSEEAVPAPAVAEEQAATQPVAASSPSAGPPLGFWLLALVLGGALLAMSLATGAPVTPATARARAGRVLDSVQRRATTRGAA